MKKFVVVDESLKREYKLAIRFLLALALAVLIWLSPIAGAFGNFPDLSNLFSWRTAFAATSQDVTVNATPAYISISNAPSTFNFGVIAAGSTPDTTSGWFTITNSSTVNTDISANCTGWTSTGSAWTYSDPAADTGNLDSSSANGGVGGSTGAGAYDISVPSSSSALLCDNVTSVTNPTWELQLDAPSSFTHGDEQETTVTVIATAE